LRDASTQSQRYQNDSGMNFAHESGDAFVSVYFARCTITATFCQVCGSWRNSFPVPGWSDLAKSELAGNRKPLNFLLDLGARINAIDLRTARTLGVLLGSRQTVLGVNGQGFAFQVSDLHAVCAGVGCSKNGLGCRPPRVE
jgi:hypothetical protein